MSALLCQIFRTNIDRDFDCETQEFHISATGQKCWVNIWPANSNDLLQMKSEMEENVMDSGYTGLIKWQGEIFPGNIYYFEGESVLKWAKKKR